MLGWGLVVVVVLRTSLRARSIMPMSARRRGRAKHA